MRKEKSFTYQEVQRPKQILLWISMSINAGIMWYWFIQQIIFGIPFGTNTASDGFTIVIWAIFGVGLPFFTFVIVRFIIEVRNDGIYIRFFPFKYKPFPLKDINSYESIEYDSIKQFGGWEYRLNHFNETAYNMSGKRGVKVELNNKKVIMIGTERPGELVAALNRLTN